MKPEQSCQRCLATIQRAAGLAFLLATGFPVAAIACTPNRDLYDAPTAGVLAERLFAEASAIVYAKVLSAAEETAAPHAVLGQAEIEILEHFKGPRELTRIYTWVRRASCSNPAFVAGEERLFALYEQPVQGNGRRFHELHAWRNPRLDSDELRAELRTLAGSK